jgi:hypothetical protein
MIQLRDQLGQATVDERELARTLGAWHPGASSARRQQFKDLQRDLIAGHDTSKLQAELGLNVKILKSRLQSANIVGSPRWFGRHSSGEESTGGGWFGRHRAPEGARSTSQASAAGVRNVAPERQLAEPVQAQGDALPRRTPFIAGPTPLPAAKVKTSEGTSRPEPSTSVPGDPDAPALPKRIRGSNEPKRPSRWAWFAE